jgi:hypothetical protein
VTHLVLAFGDAPWDMDQPEVRIETRRADLQSFGDSTVEVRVVAGQMAREQVGHLWRETGVLRDDVRRAAFAIDGVRGDPTIGWDHASLNVDGETVSFSVLVEGEHWVALAIVGEVVVGVQSRRWPVSETGLRAVGEFDPYVTGAREIRRRWPL